jgi:hypothetical protein
VTTSTYPLRTLGKYNWNNKFWNMVSTYVVKVMFLIGTRFTISKCRSRYEADLAVAVVSFISRSIGLMQSKKSPNLELFSGRTSCIAELEIKRLI